MGLFQAIGSVVGGVFRAVGDVVTLRPAQAVSDVVGGISDAIGNLSGNSGIDPSSNNSVISSLSNAIASLFSGTLGKSVDIAQTSNQIPDSVKTEISYSMNGSMQKIEHLFEIT